MRSLLTFLMLAAMAACAHATEVAAPTAPQVQDAELAQRLGADERGMRMYMLVILRTGPYTPQSDEERARLFEGHFGNINRLADEGKMVVAGPLDENDHNYRGIFVLDTTSVEEAQAMVAADPTIASGVFVAEFYPWYSSAALMEIPSIHRRIAP